MKNNKLRVDFCTKWSVNTIDGGIACSSVLEEASQSTGEKVGIES